MSMFCDGDDLGGFPGGYDINGNGEVSPFETAVSLSIYNKCASLFDDDDDSSDYDYEYDEYDDYEDDTTNTCESEPPAPQTVVTYPNIRQAKAAEMLNGTNYVDEEYRKCCEFILEKHDTILAANYLTRYGHFLYAQAIKDHFELPVCLPDEDEDQDIDFKEILNLIARKDVPLAVEVWHWAVAHFLPYSEYDQFSADALTYFAFSNANDDFVPTAVTYMDAHPDFRTAVMQKCEHSPFLIEHYIYYAIEHKMTYTAKYIFETCITTEGDCWHNINKLVDNVIRECSYNSDDTLDAVEFFEQELFPFVKTVKNEMVAQEIEIWEAELSQIKKSILSRLEDDSNQDDEDEDWEYSDADDEDVDDDTNEDADTDEMCDTDDTVSDSNNSVTFEEILNDKTIYTYYGVKLACSRSVYSYLSKDESIQIGDTVLVPVGKELQGMTGEVVSVGHYKRIAVPYPIEKSKTILCKLDLPNI